MRTKMTIVLIATVLILAVGLQVGLSQTQKASGLDTDRIIHKLDEILANQTQMLKRFDEVKKELAIIKVRASRR